MSARAEKPVASSNPATKSGKRTLFEAVQPTLDFVLQNIERYRAVIEKFRMKRADIEARPHDLFRPRAQVQYFPLAQEAAQRLAGQGEIAVNGLAHGRLVDRQQGVQVIDRRLAGPSQGVQTGVDHEALSALQLQEQRREFGFRIAVQTQLLAQRSGVRTPALDERGVAAESAESRQVGALLGDRRLKMVPGRRLAQKERGGRR